MRNGLDIPRKYIWDGATNRTQQIIFLAIEGIEVDTKDVFCDAVKQWT